MKKLYRSKGTVHPSPPPPPPPPPSQQHISDHYLSFLPAAILTLTVALSPQDKQVLAYLISCSSSSPSYSSCHFPGSSRSTKNTHKSSSASASASATNKSGDHPPLFNCNCFRCYMSYWVRWDSSPNRQLIHEIIDAFEDSLVIRKETTTKSCKKDRRAKKVGSTTTTTTTTTTYSTVTESTRPSEPESGESDPVGDVSNSSGGEVGDEVEGEEGYGDEKGSVRKIVSFLGERIWGVWT